MRKIISILLVSSLLLACIPFVSVTASASSLQLQDRGIPVTANEMSAAPEAYVKGPDTLKAEEDAVANSDRVENLSFNALGASADDVDRYTVLILDNSVSMEGTPLTYLKEAASDFCSELFASSGNNQLAIVTYDTTVVDVCDFTSDQQILLNTINNMDGQGGWTNINAAASKAYEMLMEADADIRNLIIMTDGLPTYGAYSGTGRYSSADCSSYGYSAYYYEYANSLYNNVTAMFDDCNVYSLGYFHNMSSSTKDFGVKLLTDLQNAGYYEVVDPANLEFIFGELADDVVNGADNDPVIIIPGIMGSRLFSSDTDFSTAQRVWDPPTDDFWDILDIENLNEQMDMSNELFVRPFENQNDLESGTVATYGREYGATEIYKELVDGLCDAFPDREVYVFSYDWRKSNEDSAQKLAAAIRTLDSEQVDLVCHSMGGLVASSYFDQFASENRIDKIITCGTPYEGAPKLINSVQNWDVLGEGIISSGDDWADLALGIWGGMTKSLKSSFLGVAELTPTKNYVGEIPMWEDSWKPFNKGDYELSYNDYVKICKKIFGETNYTNAQNFQNGILGSDGYNKLLNYENSYFLVGINHPTITAVKFQWIGNDIDGVLYESDLSYDMKGDGTVPYLSASIMEQLENLDEKRFVKKDVDHTETVQDGDCIDWVAGILKDGKSTVADDPMTNNGYTVIRIACPVDVTITADGNTMSSSSESFASSSSFGRLDILGENDEIKFLCVETGEDYQITLNGTAEGEMDYAIRFFDADGTQTDERIFEGIPLTDGTIISTDATNDGEITMDVDIEGDGVVDQVWTAEESDWLTTNDEDRIPLESIKVSAKEDTVVVGSKTTISVSLNPVNTTDKIAITYSSSDPDVATVDDDGVVTAVAPGTTIIEATATNGMVASVEITVEENKLVAPAIRASGNTTTGKPKLSWNKVAAADFYRIYRSTSRTSGYKYLKSTTSTAFTDTTAEAGTNYYYKVKSVEEESGETSGWSNIVNRCCDLAKPDVTLTVKTATGKPVVKWGTVSGAAKYRVYRSTSKSSGYSLVNTTTGKSYTDTTAKAGTNYYYKVKAIHSNSSANSAYSAVVNRVCDLAKPTVSISYSSTSGKPIVKWETVSGAAKYRVYRSTSKSSGYELIYTAVSARTYTDKTAVAGTNYYYKVMAVHTNSSANSAYSAVVNRVCDLAKPVVSITRSSGDPKISWEKIEGAEKYYVYRATSKSGTYKKVKTTIAATSYTDTSATAGKTYYYKVRAIHSNSAANSAYSSVKYITAK